MSKKLIVTAFAAISFSVACNAEETTTITFEKLPSPVRESALKHLLPSSIKKVEAIDDDGITIYEIESEIDGVNKDITFAANGSVMEIEQSMSFAQLPLAAREKISKRYPKLKITKVESVQDFYFDVDGEDHGKSVELKVSASGALEEDDD